MSRTNFLVFDRTGTRFEKFYPMKKTQHRRSDCPISFGLERFGDRWTLLIVRDIVYFGKRTYGEFLESDEHIATNILADRLTQLEQNGILTKTHSATDKRREIYTLTDKGLDLIPILLEIATWSFHHDPQTGAPEQWISLVNANKEAMTALIRETVRNGGAIFVGPNSVVSKLALQG